MIPQDTSDADDVLVAPPPRFTPADAEDIGRRLFGVTGSASDLGSERDQNFRLVDDAGRSVVLKVSNSAEPADV